MNKIEKFINDYQFDNHIVFAGLPGRGKTYIMQKLFEKLPENENSLVKYWLDDGEFRENINSGNMSLMPNDKKVKDALDYPFEMCLRVKYLFFDDVGSSLNVSDPQRTKLKYILDVREKNNLLTIFSTNSGPKEIEKLYGETIKSRIYNGKHKKGLTIITVKGEDRRKENIKSITL